MRGLHFGGLKCQDGAVFSFSLFASYSNFKRLNCLHCVWAGIHDEFKMQQSMRRHSAASWLACNRPFARDPEMCHRSASIPCKFIDGLGGHFVLEHHDHRTLVGHVQLVDCSVVGWHVCSSTYERRYCLFQSTKRCGQRDDSTQRRSGRDESPISELWHDDV